MASSSSSSSSTVKFIEKAFLATGSFALSYTDPDQKWLIRKHLTSFLQDYPNWELSTDTFNHNNGARVFINPDLTTTQLPTVQLTIWIHENYPITPPLVFINPDLTTTQLPTVQLTIWIHENYPITPPLVFINPDLTTTQLPTVQLTIWIHENYPITPPLVFINPDLTTTQLPTVQLTIWIHENYPITPPLVFINPDLIPIRTNNPFVSSSGFTNSRYIDIWEYPR
ncbi:PREDICTED: uncharacterized protein LOC104742061 [Camelina sativa]|uniref:Uncharacterized protein LOC104742061 n=1 Tax=Camelina sativa TaxID=90675 RepID=A0ABM0VUK7_CAMSA|nr:PREDICTED: uncharacterized protein LOC104742061 [Camelina sativa]